MKSIAIFDYCVTPTNPAGSCHRRMIERLAEDVEFTVFAVEFDDPTDGKVRFRRIPVPPRPLALLFLAYHLVAPIRYGLELLRRGRRFDRVQGVESNFGFADVVYAHFCHRAYLRRPDRPRTEFSLRSWFRWLDHRLHAALEPWVFRRARRIVTPSPGLARELEREYPAETRGKVVVIPNPVDTDRMRRPAEFDRAALRRSFGGRDDDLVLAFAALGHFERKGLPVLMEALRRIDDPRIRLLVIGGRPELVAEYRRKALASGLHERITFTGHQNDIRPWFWAADAFVFPSCYETFSLVSIEAAAAGLPLIVPTLHGVEDVIRDGENGFVINRDAESVAAAIRRLAALDPATRDRFSIRAAESARRFSLDGFAPRWRAFYAGLDAAEPDRLTAATEA
jgi:glycosyltransferase involved in cell wall biosynthesis